MRKLSFAFTVLKVPIDFIQILLAAVLAHVLRFKIPFVTELRPATQLIPFTEYMEWAFIMALFMVIIFSSLHLYSPHLKKKFFDELFGIINGCSLGVLGAILVMFFSRALLASRFIILVFWAGSIVLVVFGRLLVRFLRYIFFKNKKGLERVVIIGKGASAGRLADFFLKNPAYGYCLAGRFEEFSKETEQKICELHHRASLDAIFAIDPEHTFAELSELLSFTDEAHITLKYGADFFITHTPKLAVETLLGIPLVEVKRTSLEGWGKIVKRAFDFIGSLVLLLFLAIPMGLVAVLIKLNSRGPVFFSRRDNGSPLQRVGQYGKPFNYFKFRSMVDKCDSWRYTKLKELNFRKGPLVKIKDDPRVTKVGRFIRRFSIDELPELFLVLIGRMSLVGPRPHLPEEVAQYKKEYKRLFLVKPGITGFAQISGRSDLDFDEEARLDMMYIENWSLLYDLIILLKTPWVVLKGVRG
jgi:exopolysaccharide biosynthesis polyprenyl glycosylphosphotransferase